MALETTLISRAWVVIAIPLVLLKFDGSEELVFVCKDFLVPCTEITHHFVVQRLHVAMEIRPPQAGNVTIAIRAVVLQQQSRVVKYASILEVHAQIVV